MVGKTALYTLVSTVVIAALALTVEASGVHIGPQPQVASISGASASWTASGRRGDWASERGSAYVSGASGSYSSGGARGNWGMNPYVSGASRMFGGGDDHDGHDGHDGHHRFGGDHDGWDDD